MKKRANTIAILQLPNLDNEYGDEDEPSDELTCLFLNQ